MKNIERIIKYTEYDLPESERLRFDDDLTSDPILKQEYSAFLRNRAALMPPAPPADEGTAWFATTVVRMRAHLSEKNSSPLSKPVFASLASSLLVFSLVFLLNGIQNPAPPSGFLTQNERQELENILAGDENDATQLNSTLLPTMSGERTQMDEEDFAALETELASSIAPTEEERIAMLNELASSDDLIATLSDEEVDDLVNALTNEND